MNGMNDENQPDRQDYVHDPQQNQTPVAFCQSCGKALDRETIRIVGPAIYCEPCLAARLAGTPNSTAAYQGAAAYQNAAAYQSAPGYSPSADAPPGTSSTTPGAAGGWVPPPPSLDPANPGLAALLGFIPGVGAMYNGQYAKGIIHLIVFAVLISLANVNGIFGLFIAGWVFYMVIEAHHTAKARRDGTMLPNPFGLNDIGERLGFGRAWATPPGTASAPDFAGVVHDATHAAANVFNPAAAPPPNQAPSQNPNSPPPQWGAPTDAYSYPSPAYSAQQQPPPPYAQAQAYGTPFTPPLSQESPYIAPQHRFPAGAVWLIGLGLVFLLSTTGLLHGLIGPALVGFALVGLGVWLFLRRMMESGLGLADDGSAGYRLRLLRALRISIWFMLIGVLFLLNVFNLVTWHKSWPIFIIVAGVLTLLERTTYNATAAPSSPQTATPSSAFNPYPSTATGSAATSTPVDTLHHDAPHQEGN